MPEIINKCPALRIDTKDPPKDEGKVGRDINKAIDASVQYRELFAWIRVNHKTQFLERQ